MPLEKNTRGHVAARKCRGERQRLKKCAGVRQIRIDWKKETLLIIQTHQLHERKIGCGFGVVPCPASEIPRNNVPVNFSPAAKFKGELFEVITGRQAAWYSKPSSNCSVVLRKVLTPVLPPLMSNFPFFSRVAR